MPTGYVISDLHMFARWSRPSEYIERMGEAAAEADFFVLNGDIFDFRWSILPGMITAKALTISRRAGKYIQTGVFFRYQGTAETSE